MRPRVVERFLPDAIRYSGWSNRLGWYEGFHLLVSASPDGVVTGFGRGPASTKDHPLAETFFAARHAADPRLPSVGRPSGEPDVADGGQNGRITKYSGYPVLVYDRHIMAPSPIPKWDVPD